MRIVEHNASRQEEHQVRLINFSFTCHDANGEQHGKEKLVFLKQRTANVAVQRESEVVVEELQTRRDVRVPFCVLN